MARIQNLKSGSASCIETNNTTASNRINFFKSNDVYYTFLSNSKDCCGVILPAFDPTFSELDPARKTSVGSYRNKGVLMSDGNEEFSGWFVMLKCYTFFGKSSNMIISPLSVGGADPIDMVRRHIKFECTNDEELQKLLNRQTVDGKFRSPYLQNVRDMAFMNAYCNGTRDSKFDDGSYRNRVLILSKSANELLLTALNEPRPYSMSSPNDESWPNYRLGDVTNPNCALEFRSKTHVLQPSGIKLPILNFVQMGGKINRFQITEQMLSGRYDLFDDAIIHIPTYEELVDLMVADQEVPYDVIERICRHRYSGSFPKNPAGDAAHVRVSAPKAAAHNTIAPAAAAGYMEDDEDDDIPMGPNDYNPAPAPAPNPTPVSQQATKPAAPAAGSGLTPQEQEEFAALRKKLIISSLSDVEIMRFKELHSKQSAN